MKEPPIRYATRAAQDILAERLGVTIDPYMQDFEHEVLQASELPRYLALFQEYHGQDDLRFSLAELILGAFEDLAVDPATNADWQGFVTALVARLDVHGWQIWYWASWDSDDLEDAWHISPMMRALCREHFGSS